MNVQEMAEKEFVECFAKFKVLRQDAMDCLAGSIRKAHDAGITDEGLSELIDRGFSRSRIRQIRVGLISRKETNV